MSLFFSACGLGDGARIRLAPHCPFRQFIEHYRAFGRLGPSATDPVRRVARSGTEIVR
jgi:hypothetical protein